LEDAEQRSLEEILDLVIRTPDQDLVALRNVISTERGMGPVTIERKDQQRIITISANVEGRDLGSVATDIEAQLQTIPTPIGYDLRIGGNVEEQEKAFNELMWSLVLALALVYMVLAAQYESFTNPLIVMMAVPFAFTGVFVVLFLTNTTLNLQSGIGCIMLGGIVVNNAILLVDQASQYQRDGMNAREAALHAGARRLRPVLMTTSTTILALFPLALGIGEGADAQAPMARAVLGGLTASTLITLVLIPVIYSMVHGFRDRAVAGVDSASLSAQGIDQRVL
jgi:HAE1 family hydrophobic/amphiphilic exporter-1